VAGLPEDHPLSGKTLPDVVQAKVCALARPYSRTSKRHYPHR